MKPKRIYEIEVVKRPHKIVERVFDKETKRFTDRERVVKGGFMVYFPQKHSTFFETEEQLDAFVRRNGNDAGYIDMESGMPIPEGMLSMSLRDLVERNTTLTPPSRSGVDASIAQGE